MCDSRNRLVQVNLREGREAAAGGTGYSARCGRIFAKFSYNALGWRTSAVYDSNGDGLLSDETIEYYGYDERWRLVRIDRQGPVMTTGAHQDERPAIRPYQLISYYADDMGGKTLAGWQPSTDRPLMRLRDTDGDGQYDEKLNYIQNARGDVVGLMRSVPKLTEDNFVRADPSVATPRPPMDHTATGPYPLGNLGGDGANSEVLKSYGMSAANGDFRGRYVERYKYSVFGQPDCISPSDIDFDGIVDARLILTPGEPAADHEVFSFARDVEWSSTGSGPEDRIGDIRADIDGDGLITKWDELLEQRNRESWWQAGAAPITPVIDPVLDDAALRAQAGGLNLDEYGRFDGRGELSVVLPHVQNADGTPITQGTTQWRAHRARAEVMLDNRHGFAGYVWDPWLKVYHVRHRVYMPGTQDGRDVGPSWLQPDPIGIAGGLNLYEYCNGDPMSFVDPMGCGAGTMAGSNTV